MLIGSAILSTEIDGGYYGEDNVAANVITAVMFTENDRQQHAMAMQTLPDKYAFIITKTRVHAHTSTHAHTQHMHHASANTSR